MKRTADRWLPDLDKTAGAKYLAIADAIAVAVETGGLRTGDRLPTQRDLAARLGVDLTTVTRAYQRARTHGLIGARGRAGSFVLSQPAIAAGAPPRDTGMNMPPVPDGGTLVATWERTTSALLRAPGAEGRLHYTPAGGRADDRAAGAAIFARIGLASDADVVVLAAGAQNALHAIAATTLTPGDVVACGTFVYPGLLAVAHRMRLRLAPLPRLDAEALEAACRSQRIAALYIVPTNDNPTTSTLDPDQRAALAVAARRHGVRLIEDDAYCQLAERPLAPLTCHAPELGWYIASTSKVITPALRVAHVRAPSLKDALALAAEVHMTNGMAPPLNAALVTCWVADGSYDRLIAETRAEASARRAIAAAILTPGSYAAADCGYHLWIPLAEGCNPARIATALRGAGLAAITADSFAAGDERASALRVSLGGAIDRTTLRRALTLLELERTTAGGAAVI